MVFIGTLSYSFYLWHWPIISLTFYMADALTLSQGIVCLLVSFGLAYLSWRYVESLFRDHDRFTQKVIFASSFTTVALALGVGFAFWKLDGLPNRINPDFLALVEPKNYIHDQRNCHFMTAARGIAGDICLRGDAAQEASFAFSGDSHADSISRPIFEAAAQLGLAGYQYTSPGHFPFVGVNRIGRNDVEQTDALIEFLDARPSLEILIITGFWEFLFTGYSYRHAGHVWVDDDYDGSRSAYNPTAARNGLLRLAKRFPDHQIILLDDLPTGVALHLRSQLRLMRFGNDPIRGLASDEMRQQRLTYEANLIVIANSADNLHDRPFYEGVCPLDFCPLFGGDVVLYRDGDHLSWEGALRLTDRAVELLDALPGYLNDGG